MTFKIKKGLPLPALDIRTKYPFPQMEVKDYFDVPADDPAATRNSNGNARVQSSAHSWGRRFDRKFHTSRLADGTVRIQRIK
jgi:hypothetical protein